jgi:hypothetical protein
VCPLTIALSMALLVPPSTSRLAERMLKGAIMCVLGAFSCPSLSCAVNLATEGSSRYLRSCPSSSSLLLHCFCYFYNKILYFSLLGTWCKAMVPSQDTVAYIHASEAAHLAA